MLLFLKNNLKHLCGLESRLLCEVRSELSLSLLMNNWRCARSGRTPVILPLKQAQKPLPAEVCRDTSCVPFRFWSRRGATVRCGYGGPQLPRLGQPQLVWPSTYTTTHQTRRLPAPILVQKTLLSQAVEPAPGRMTQIHLGGCCSGMTWQRQKDLGSAFLAWV